MNEDTQRKLVAGGKVALGGTRVVLGLITSAGGGIAGTFLRNHSMRQTAFHVGQLSANEGKKMFEEGWSELHR